jgi:hypothetical protein
MRIHFFRSTALAAVLVVLGFSPFALGQNASVAVLLPDEPMRSRELEPSPFVSSTQPATSPPETSSKHKFWDRENSALFAATAAFSAADFVVTRDNLRSGGQEFNPLTRVMSGSTGGLAANFAGETAGVVGLSYFFHRTRHHRLERAASMLDIGGSASAVTFGLLHR